MIGIDLRGKRGVITGVANKFSIAWAIAQKFHNSGMDLILTCQNEKLRKKVEELVQGMGNVSIFECDVKDERNVKDFFDGLRREGKKIYSLVHSIAYAPTEELGDSFLITSREGFKTALEISAYSLLMMVRECEDLFEEGASILTLTYLASEKVVPGYNVMGVAKAALESIVRYLAYEMGKKGVRVNAISAGPLNTLAARGIKGFTKILDVYPQRSPLKRNITHEEVANTALFLTSPLASGITGEIIFVDAGYHIMGI